MSSISWDFDVIVVFRYLGMEARGMGRRREDQEGCSERDGFLPVGEMDVCYGLSALEKRIAENLLSFLVLLVFLG